MLNRFIHFFHDRTGVMLYPRFVVSFLAIILALGIFVGVFILVSRYKQSIMPMGPRGQEAQADYDSWMRNPILKVRPTVEEVNDEE